jgi:hypothetical protein
MSKLIEIFEPGQLPFQRPTLCPLVSHWMIEAPTHLYQYCLTQHRWDGKCPDHVERQRIDQRGRHHWRITRALPKLAPLAAPVVFAVMPVQHRATPRTVANFEQQAGRVGRGEPAAPSADPSIARTFVSPLGGCSLQVFVWAPGSKTPIYDHTSWGAYSCVAGSVLEDRYERLDDGTQLNRAHLRHSWRRELHCTDRASTVAPYAGGIHRISNPSSRPAVSAHLYGPRLGRLDGRDYDPSHDYVCDRYGREQSVLQER